MFGDTLAEKGGDIGRCRHVLKLRQAGEIELLRDIAFGNRPDGASALTVGASRSGCFASCLRCDHRARKLLLSALAPRRSCAASSFIWRTFRCSLTVAARTIPLALVKRALDMEFIDEGGDPRRDVGGIGTVRSHRSALEYRLPFGRIGRYFCQLEFGAAILTRSATQTRGSPSARLSR